MKELIEKLAEDMNAGLCQITVSDPRKQNETVKYTVRPVAIRDRLKFQLTAFRGNQVFHENLDRDRAVERLGQCIPDFRQVRVQTTEGNWTARISKKGKVTIRRQHQAPADAEAGKSSPESPAILPVSLAHNRARNYIIKEGLPVPFLVDLGVMTAEGAVVKRRYDKFRQVNRFLEFIEDILPALPRDREVSILDFGCGKSYLTFAMYYYLKELKGYNVRITGLDRKKDVIARCNMLAEKYAYDRLSFLKGDVEDYSRQGPVDMMVTLHACDTATDYALYKAVEKKASVILSVPCCQHELNRQYRSEELSFAPLGDYGILRDRFCALATDGIRAKLLEAAGYDTQILEFIDMEHTPKNLLIRAVRRRSGGREECRAQAQALADTFGFRPTLLTLMKEGGLI